MTTALVFLGGFAAGTIAGIAGLYIFLMLSLSGMFRRPDRKVRCSRRQ